jgi:hypothetical protein
MTTPNHSTLKTAIEELKAAASQLPACDRAAKLAGLVRRIEWTLADGADVTAAITALARATQQTLEDHPWVQLDWLAQRLRRDMSATDPETQVERRALRWG